MRQGNAVSILCAVVAALCFIAVLIGLTGDVGEAKILAAGGLATLGAIFFP